MTSTGTAEAALDDASDGASDGGSGGSLDDTADGTADQGAREPARDGRGGRAAARRRARQQEIVASTRRLFDDRGTRSANIDDIARSVGINRAIIYRHFASKEELFALTLADYLEELDAILLGKDDPSADPRARLATVTDTFARYCLRYPAFVDCALALLGRRGEDLLDEISESALARLIGLMSGELGRIADLVLADATSGAGPDAASGTDGALSQKDADLLANALYMQVLGVMHLARSGFIVRSPGTPAGVLGGVEQEEIIALVSRMALSVAFTR